MRIRKRTMAALGMAVVAGACSVAASGIAVAGAATNGSPSFTPRPVYAVLHTAKADVSPQTFSTPSWTFKYVYNGVTYRETFVGTKPKTGTTTTVRTYIIPIKLTYGSFTTNPTTSIGGGNSAVQNTVASPLFQPGIDYVQGGTDLGTTQYIDAFQRGALWGKVKKHLGYHVLLGQPKVKALQSITVPSEDGELATASSGAELIVANINWFDPVAESLLSSLSIPANSLPIFVVTQAYLSENSDTSGCCIGGYHNYNGTKAYAEFSYIQQSGQFSQDVSALSHEIGEYVDDPLTNNYDVPASCGTQGNDSQIYEVGDPLEGDANFGAYPYVFGGFTYHLQDLVLPPYFGAPASTSVNGWDTFQGTTLSVCQNGG